MAADREIVEILSDRSRNLGSPILIGWVQDDHLVLLVVKVVGGLSE